jgi:hypothetical protein
MSPSSIHHGLGPGAGLLLALLGWLTLAPGAEAHCGSRAKAAAAASRDPSAGLEVVALGAESSPSAPGPTPACDGPSCSRRTPTHLPGRGFEPLHARGDGLAEVVAPPHPPASSRRTRAVDETLDDPRTPSEVFHPPRRPC